MNPKSIPHAKPILRLLSCVAMAAAVPAGCKSDGTQGPVGNGGATGGSVGSGGASTAGTGGSGENGGTVGSGGATGTGGVSSGGTGSGGTTDSGGATGSGGTNSGGTGSGGRAASGGNPGAGGTSRAGGATGSGGAAGSGSGGATVAAGGTGAGGAKTGGAGGGGGGAAGAAGGSPAGGSTGGGGTGACPAVDFGTWTSGKDPTTVGKAAVDNFKPRTSESYGGDGYAWTFGYVGSLQFTKTIADTTNNDFLVSKFDCNQQGPDNSASATVDTRAFGDLPLEIFIEKGTAACKTLGLARADAQWSRTTSDGITSDARYWIDDMYMITSLQVFAYRATKDTKYLDRAAKAMIAYIGQLQKNNDTKTDGLFWHTKQSHAYWGRANGWVASGMTELLLDLGAGADRDQIMAAYKKQMDGLLQNQITSGTDVGAWRQVIDRTDAKPEMSCSAMFTFALATGAKNGWLTDPKYAAAAAAGWKAVAARTNSSGQLDQVCPGTGQANAGDLASQQQFYMNIAFQANDRHGQGPELWAANALLRKDCPGVR
jgi:unsaturated rhamnogalacturonyl hydrolase